MVVLFSILAACCALPPHWESKWGGGGRKEGVDGACHSLTNKVPPTSLLTLFCSPALPFLPMSLSFLGVTSSASTYYYYIESGWKIRKLPSSSSPNRALALRESRADT